MSYLNDRPDPCVQIVAAAAPGRVRRRLHAIDVLVTRLTLLAVAGVLLVFLLVSTNIAQVGGVGLVMFAVVAGWRAAVRAFGRSWKGEEGRDDQRTRRVA